MCRAKGGEADYVTHSDGLPVEKVRKGHLMIDRKPGTREFSLGRRTRDSIFERVCSYFKDSRGAVLFHKSS